MINRKLAAILFVFLLALCFCSQSEAFITGVGVPATILTRIFLIKFKGDYGTAFTIEVNNRQYLITAKHVVEGIGKKGNIHIFHDSQWKPLEVRVVYCDETDIDIVVLILPFQLSPSSNIKTTEDGISLGQDIYFLGFPYEMYSLADTNINGKFPFPFVKKGVISAIKYPPAVWYVDGNSNRGFSGGPVVFFDVRDNSSPAIPTIGAVASEYFSEQAVVKDVKQNKIVRINVGSGILKAYGIHYALDAIAKKPEGPVIKK
jgi:hypothetical protein